ncbi:anthrax toxin receptor-like [Physeter macrocephalus]|uniref:Anthrax toxin receptor-like n=1 Tax=Physeter macrocephalus TaxID=9755 RepID=A0A2Y9FF39_PHYMC|nr:anthrax toxin receptor-like [Physeter catodon]|eukprot:XP_007121367.2 anthrax toxin receptor-like [Physeter catodon]
MGSGGSAVPGPMLFLLLVLPPPLLSTGSFQHDGPGWKDLHHLSLDLGNLYRHLIQDTGTFHHLRGPSTRTRKSWAKDENSCQSSFDLYFILDMSGSVNNNWMDIYTFVEDLVKKYDNPNLRISFITYSTLGHTLMKLTSDRNEIRDGLSRLKNIVPTGATHMQEGFKKANEQIQQANSGENKVPSMIISLTDGTLEEASFEMTKEEAEKAREMGATVYCVGVKNFEEDQLLEIADSPHHVFGVDQGFKALKYIIEPLETKSCIEITAVEPSSVCTGDESELMISGKGFNNAKRKDEVICRFKFNDKQFFAPGTPPQRDLIFNGNFREVFVEVSLNNGVSFINNNVSISSKNCASTREGGPDYKNAPPAAQQPPEEPPSSPPPKFIPYVNPLYFCALIPALLLFLLMLWCIWWLCRRKTIKEPPPVQKPEREPEETCQMSCPTVIVPCGCQGGGVKRMEGKCLNFALTKPHCGQLHCSPKVCLQPSRECFSVKSCCSQCQYPPPVCSRLPSRMQPLISPSARPRCGATLPTKCAASCDEQQTHGWGSRVCASGPAPAPLPEPSVPKCKGPTCCQGLVAEAGHSVLPSSTLLPMDILYSSFTADSGTWLTLPHSPKPTVIPGNFNIYRMTQDLLASNSLH